MKRVFDVNVRVGEQIYIEHWEVEDFPEDPFYLMRLYGSIVSSFYDGRELVFNFANGNSMVYRTVFGYWDAGTYFL